MNVLKSGKPFLLMPTITMHSCELTKNYLICMVNSWKDNPFIIKGSNITRPDDASSHWDDLEKFLAIKYKDSTLRVVPIS